MVIFARIADPTPQEFVAGLVPDGTDSVQVTLSDGSTTRVPVIDNVYTVAASRLSVVSVSFATADAGAVTLEL